MPQNIYFYNNTSLAEAIADVQSIYGTQTTSNIVEFQAKYGHSYAMPNTYDNIVQFTGNDQTLTWETVNGKQAITTNKVTQTADSVTTEVTGVACLVGLGSVFKRVALGLGMKSTTAETIDNYYMGALYPAYRKLCTLNQVSEDRLANARVLCQVDKDGKLRVPENFVNDTANAIDQAGLSKSYRSLDLDINTDIPLTDLSLSNDMFPIWKGLELAVARNRTDLREKMEKVLKNSIAVASRNNLLLELSQQHLDYNTISYSFSDSISLDGTKVTLTADANALLVSNPLRFLGKTFSTVSNHWQYLLDSSVNHFVLGVRTKYIYDYVYNTYETITTHITSPEYINNWGLTISDGEATTIVSYGNSSTMTTSLPEGIEYIGDPLTSLDYLTLGQQYPAWLYNLLHGLLPVGDPLADPSAEEQQQAQSGAIKDSEPYPWQETEPEPVPPINPSPDAPPIEPPTPEPVPFFPPIPPLPSFNANKLFTVHTISDAQMNVLGSYLWSSDFVSLIEHMFTEPINAVLGLHELHYGGSISTGGSEEIKLGAFGSGANGNLVTNRYLEFSCGTIKVPEFYGNVEDYEPYTKLQLYLPYIGYVSIDTNEVMGKKLTVKYGIDVYTGGCVARVFVNSSGVTQELYNFNGQCGLQLPVTSADYSSLVSRPLLGATLGAVSGGVVGAVTGGLTGAMNSKITYNRSNGFNSNTGAMTNQKPVLIIERPIVFNAQSYPSFYGNPTNWTVTLSQCTGYTRVKDIHLDKTKATNEEKLEIENLLKEGVIF